MGAAFAGGLEQALRHADHGGDIRVDEQVGNDIAVLGAADQTLRDHDARTSARLQQRQNALEKQNLRWCSRAEYVGLLIMPRG